MIRVVYVNPKSKGTLIHAQGDVLDVIVYHDPKTCIYQKLTKLTTEAIVFHEDYCKRNRRNVH